MSNDELARFRNRNVGFVFQFHHLLPEFTASRTWPCRDGSEDRQGRFVKTRRAALLAELGLEARRRHFPNQLSGGEQQRVAIARALLATRCFSRRRTDRQSRSETSERVFDLMRECHVKRGLTSVIVTHNRELAARCDRVFEMRQRLELISHV